MRMSFKEIKETDLKSIITFRALLHDQKNPNGRKCDMTGWVCVK